jgi:hypothetical protein
MRIHKGLEFKTTSRAGICNNFAKIRLQISPPLLNKGGLQISVTCDAGQWRRKGLEMALEFEIKLLELTEPSFDDFEGGYITK